MESYGVKQATRSRGWKECDEVDEKAAIDFSLFPFSLPLPFPPPLLRRLPKLNIVILGGEGSKPGSLNGRRGGSGVNLISDESKRKLLLLRSTCKSSLFKRGGHGAFSKNK